MRGDDDPAVARGTRLDPARPRPRLRVTPVTIYNWERGRTEPRVSQFRQLARLFGVGMDEIVLEGEELRDEIPAPPANP